jgi:hypothetical protein
MHQPAVLQHKYGGSGKREWPLWPGLGLGVRVADLQ